MKKRFLFNNQLGQNMKNLLTHMHSGSILEAEKPVFLSSGRWVFFGPTCRLRCCTLFTMAENCSKTSCIQTPRGDQKRTRNSAILGAQSLPHNMALSWERGIYFAGDSIEWKFDLLMNLLLNFVLPKSLCRLAGWGTGTLETWLFCEKKNRSLFLQNRLRYRSLVWKVKYKCFV